MLFCIQAKGLSTMALDYGSPKSFLCTLVSKNICDFQGNWHVALKQETHVNLYNHQPFKVYGLLILNSNIFAALSIMVGAMTTKCKRTRTLVNCPNQKRYFSPAYLCRLCLYSMDLFWKSHSHL